MSQTSDQPQPPGRAPRLSPHGLTGQPLTDAQRALYADIAEGPRATNSPFPLTDADGSLEGPFNAMLLAPAVGAPLQGLGAAIRYQTTLTAREREIAILALAVERQCEFEWYAHRLVAEQIGMTSEELADLAAGRAPSTASPAERLVHASTLQMLRSRTLDDALFDDARSALGTQKLAELVALVGYYDQLALSLAVWHTPLPEGAEPQFTADTQFTPDPQVSPDSAS